LKKNFEGLVKDYHVKPDKDWGKAAYILIKTEATRDIGEVQMMVGSTISIDFDKFEWQQATPSKPTQLKFEDHLEEECAVCGHTRGQHKLDDHLCLGDDGMCTCIEFLYKPLPPKEEVEKVDLEVQRYVDDASCDFCGHTYLAHDADTGCTENVCDELGDNPRCCPCFSFVPMEGQPVEAAEYPDIEEAYPVPDDGNALAGPAIETKPRRGRKKKESEVPAEVA